MTTTRWKDIPSYEGVYQVSDSGRIKRIGKAQGSVQHRVLTLKGYKSGRYSYCDLSVGNQKRRWLVHRLVAAAFLGPAPFSKAVVNHLNGNIRDNRPENLEWTSHSGNALHSYANGRVPRNVTGELNPRAKLDMKKVAEIRALKGVIGARPLAARYGVSRSAVQFIHQNKHWKISRSLNQGADA